MRVWEEEAACAVPAGLEEVRGISEERLIMKQLQAAGALLQL
jgi:hypothetical protein